MPVTPNYRLQLTSASGPSSARVLIAGGDQRHVEFGTTSLSLAAEAMFVRPTHGLRWKTSGCLMPMMVAFLLGGDR